MSDFLGRLARRAVAAPALRPRLASRFESGGSLPALHEVALPPQMPPQMPPAAPTVPARPTTPWALDEPAAQRPPMSAAPAPRRDAAPEAWAFREAATPPHRQPPAPPPASVAPRPGADATEPPGTTGVRASRPGPAGPWAEPRPAETPLPTGRRRAAAPGLPAEPTAPPADRVAPAHAEPQFPRSQIGSRVVERLTELPVRGHVAAAPLPSGSGPVPAAASAAPRVEIHIGRIELTPPAAPAAEPRRLATPQPKPPQSLETYLQQRSRS